ncbi:hypothetical protein [Limibacterium fermenti]|uniref:hypothetical protein n=1 Tax=Limibacterium fermenti TaxID=3229863 RepID=UPI000E80B0FD|nr:hypothetical protein [Porphyromonadaceae bacterium]
MNKKRTDKIILAALAGCLLMPAASCTKENTYITPVSEDYSSEDWIEEVSSRNYFYAVTPFTGDLCPSFILQADGLKKLYADSRFVQDFTTADLLMKIRNPGAGVKMTVSMQPGEINGAYNYTAAVPEELKDSAFIYVYLPVNWNYRALSQWQASRLVNLLWNISFDGQPVETYQQAFICRTVHDVAFDCSLNELEDEAFFQLIQAYMKDMGSFPAWFTEKNEFSYTANALAAGYIDEHSPLVDRLKQEVIADGYVSNLISIASKTDEPYIESIKAFSYLMQKYGLRYTIHFSHDLQYIRTIDDVFACRQGYCAELSCAFASWCLNQAIRVKLFFIPGHVYPFIELPSGALYPWDPTQMCHTEEYPDFTQSRDELFAETDRNFEQVEKVSMERFQSHYAALQAGEPGYSVLDVAAVRKYLPSFNIHEGYRNSQTRAAQDRPIRFVAAPK